MSRPRGTTKRYCKRGHDKDVTGRYGGDTCRECRHEWNRGRTKRASGEYVPAVTIRNLATKEELHAAWVVYRNCSERDADRAIVDLFGTRSLTIFDADEWLTALGSHLAIVFPALYRDVGVSA